MISFDSFQITDGIPLYQQILLYIKRGVIAGSIPDGDELPSRRMLSALLSVNPNTVQKAYRMLEEEGLIESHSGAKSFMVLDDNKVCRIKSELFTEEARRAVISLKQMGIDRKEAFALMDRLWEENEDE